MNHVDLMGRLVRDPDVRYPQDPNGMAIARYTLAVDRRRSRNQQEGQQTADFISCVAFGRAAEFAEKYLRKGIKIAVHGHIQTGSYTNRGGQKVYTTSVVVYEQEFAESKGNTQAQDSNAAQRAQTPSQKVDQALEQGTVDGFMDIPDGIDEELPFN